MAFNSTQRFSNRVNNYIRYRPGYPADVLLTLRTNGLLPSFATVADVGSGTGIFAQMLLDNGYAVYGVEPNAEMREAGERLLGGYAAFTSVNGTAEHTTLPDQCVDMVTAAQAFHWFDPEESAQEFRRILRPGAHAVLLWNERLTDSTPFLRGYEQLLVELATDYNDVNHMNVDASVLSRFFPSGYQKFAFDNAQHFDFEGVKGRMLSSSYVPAEGPVLDLMLARLRALFDTHAYNGTIAFEYTTSMYVGLPGQ